ncbi:MAG TPA: glycosyltransferase family 4 protein [Chitinophagaceae bacterium]|nr:glycosyltransferase family 4 protein [Chitinophagaceae bacterium]
MSNESRVIIVQRIFPAYRKPIFDAIYRKIGFDLLHSRNSSGIKQTSAPYSVQIRKWQYGKGDTSLFLDVFGIIKKKKPKVIIHEMAVGIVSLPLVLIGRKLFGYRLVLWGHTYNRKAGFNPRKSWGDKYRLWLQRKADAIITYSIGEKQVLMENHVKGDKIFPALNTLDTNRYFPIRNRLEELGKETVKQNLGFKHKYNLIFIGRLYEDKWPEVAIEVLGCLHNMGLTSVGLHFVGTGPMEMPIRVYAQEAGITDHVFYRGEIYDENRTGELLFASDLMIMPGCVGLSVNHAFCFNCPVVTFESKDHVPAHGPEIEYIINGKTGFVTPSRDVKKMASIVFDYLDNEELQQQTKSHIRNMIEQICPIGKLVDGFVNAIDYVSKK